jgi:5'-phosphate synthase pdxT subunit
MNSPSAAVGVLALQGGIAEHLDHLSRLGVEGRPVKEADDLEGLAGLILPGGESTCLSRLLKIFCLAEPIIRACRSGMKIWGTCAGAILLATEVIGEQPSLALVEMAIERNSFGSQLDSFAVEARIPAVSSEPLPLTFIRAPKIVRTGPGVDILLVLDGYIAAVETPGILATIFHPELTACLAFHRYFIRKCGLVPADVLDEAVIDATWHTSSWTRLAR